MAQCLRRPILSPASFPPFRCLQQRPFSIVSSQWAASRVLMGQQPRQERDRSMRVAAREMGEMPTDLGLLPQTFIFPTGANRPSLFRHPRGVARLSWIWLKRRMQGFFSLLLYKYSNEPRLQLQLRRTAATAVSLHRQMYTAFAEGDVRLLDPICADGLRESFRGRIATRPKGEKWKWELLDYISTAKVLSHRAAPLGIAGMGLRQAVVRISSRQRLTRYKPDGTIVAGSGIEKDTKEYLVIQRRLYKSVEQDWMVWGTMEETTLKMLEHEEKLDSTESSS